VRRFRNRLRDLRDQWQAGTIDIDDVDARVGAWIAHAERARQLAPMLARGPGLLLRKMSIE
jgi:hypothetical protein